MSNFMTAYEYMKEFGMHKGAAHGPNGSVCVVGACYEVGTRPTSILDKIASEQFPDRVNGERPLRAIAAFNDHPDTTLDDVRVVLEKADIKFQEFS